MSCDQFDQFPFHALLPKRETTAEAFLTKNPNFDGRGVKIAILDSGVDPGALGLSVTSDGKPKIIDMIDATGAGDVDTSTVVEPDADGYITGLTGRKLKIPSEWKNPSKKFHIGVKNLYEMFPKSVKDRIVKEYTEKTFGPNHKPALAQAIQKLNEFQKNCSEDEKDKVMSNLNKDELQARFDLLKGFETKFQHLGPTFDCVVFHDGDAWKACLDTTEEGKLDQCTVLGNYRECLKYGTISDRDKFNYAVNIYQEGNLLEIVGQCSSHGTHVASITAANFPDDPERNGVAPGAQIVSIIIGDSRLGTMETGSAIVRAFIKVIESGCDLINMSYGEHAGWADGRIFDLLHELVHQHGVIYVASAGNAGPALSTVGSPPTMPTNTIIGVGAYVTPDMMTAEYSMREKLPGTSYSWTSRGPSFNGGLGVSICAPGGAITSVPNWTLKGGQLMNGTSMASPNVCGCLGLILSALKQKQISYSPFSVRAAMENTALKVPNYDPFAHGSGLIQVEKAYEHLVQYQKIPEQDFHFKVTTNSNGALGIYLREWQHVQKPSLQLINVEPLLFKDKNQDAKINFEMNFNLTCNASWVQCPKFFNLTYMVRSFSIRIDPSYLKDGTVNFAMIEAFDVNCCEKGPVFKVPITVVKPRVVEKDEKITLNDVSRSGHFKRVFLYVPPNAVAATLTVKNGHQSEVGKFVLHTVQLKPQEAFRNHEFFKHLAVAPQSQNQYHAKVLGGYTMEVCFGKWWSCMGEADTSLEIEFEHVNLVGHNPVRIVASNCVTRLDVCNYGSQAAKISPAVKLNSLVQSIKPAEYKINPLDSRNMWPEGKPIYELILTYNLKFTKSTEFTVSFPLLSGTLYESFYESQLWMLFDSNKGYRASGDAYPANYFVKVDKGEFKVMLQIRHESTTHLERLTELPVQLNHKLRDTVSLSFYSSHYQAMQANESKRANVLTLQPNVITPLYVSSLAAAGNCMPTLKNLPFKSAHGCSLEGWLSLSQNEAVKKLNLFGVTMFVDFEHTASTKNGHKKENKEEKETAKEELDLLDHKLSFVSKLSKTDAEKYLQELESNQTLASDIRFLLAKLQQLAGESLKNPHKGQEDAGSECAKEAKLKAQVELADCILNQVTYLEVLHFFSTLKLDPKKVLSGTPSEIKQMEKKRSMLIEAMVVKGVALCRLVKHRRTHTAMAADAGQITAQIDDIWRKLTLLNKDVNESKVNVFFEQHALVHQHYARYIKLVAKASQSGATEEPNGNNQSCGQDSPLSASLETEKRIIKACKKLEWNHVVNHLERQIHVRFPKSYRLF